MVAIRREIGADVSSISHFTAERDEQKLRDPNRCGELFAPDANHCTHEARVIPATRASRVRGRGVKKRFSLNDNLGAREPDKFG